MLVVIVLLVELAKEKVLNYRKILIWLKKWSIIKHKNLLPHIKIGKETLMFRDIQIEINKPYHHKSPEDVDTDKLLVSNKISSGKETISTSLVTCTRIIKLSHYI